MGAVASKVATLQNAHRRSTPNNLKISCLFQQRELCKGRTTRCRRRHERKPCEANTNRRSATKTVARLPVGWLESRHALWKTRRYSRRWPPAASTSPPLANFRNLLCLSVHKADEKLLANILQTLARYGSASFVKSLPSLAPCSCTCR